MKQKGKMTGKEWTVQMIGKEWTVQNNACPTQPGEPSGLISESSQWADT